MVCMYIICIKKDFFFEEWKFQQGENLRVRWQTDYFLYVMKENIHIIKSLMQFASTDHAPPSPPPALALLW